METNVCGEIWNTTEINFNNNIGRTYAGNDILTTDTINHIESFILRNL